MGVLFDKRRGDSLIRTIYRSNALESQISALTSTLAAKEKELEETKASVSDDVVAVTLAFCSDIDREMYLLCECRGDTLVY